MGYTTKFKGQLGFAKEPTVQQLGALNAMFGEDFRDHPEWEEPDLYYIDLELTPAFDGVRHNGAEKTYDLEKIVSAVTKVMRKTWPDFSFTGNLLAQGESIEDRWILRIGDDGMAARHKTAVTGKRVVCPRCEEAFILEDAA